MRWTDAERQRVLSMRNNGVSMKDIAVAVHRTKHSISMMLFRADIAPNRWTTKKIQTVMDMHAKGKTDREIGRIFGKTKNVIYQLRRKIRKEHERKMDKGRNGSTD